MLYGMLLIYTHVHVVPLIVKGKSYMRMFLLIQNVKKRRRRETERVHITRVLSVGAEHGCFHLCPSSLTREGEITKEVKDFISGIK